MLHSAQQRNIISQFYALKGVFQLIYLLTSLVGFLSYSPQAVPTGQTFILQRIFLVKLTSIKWARPKCIAGNFALHEIQLFGFHFGSRLLVSVFFA